MLVRQIQFSARTIAEFMMANPLVQRRIVWTNKYPSDEESKAIVSYYRDARTAVEKFFEAGREPSIITEEICRMTAESDLANGPRKVRLGQNTRALLEFEKSSMAVCLYKILPRPKVSLELNGAKLSVRPSLCCLDESGHLRWMHLDFSDKEFEPQKAKILLQIYLLASKSAEVDLKARCAEYHHLHSGIQKYGSPHGSRIANQIAAACQTFTNIWNSI